MAYFPHRKAAIISLVELSNPFGGTIGLTIMTTVFNNVAGIGDSRGDFSELAASSSELHDITQDAKVSLFSEKVCISNCSTERYRPGFRQRLSIHGRCKSRSNWALSVQRLTLYSVF